MKTKILSVAASVLVFSILSAEELSVANPIKQLKKEWNNGTMTGKNSHAAIIKGKEYPNCWQYWYIEGGEKPENFVLKPMIAMAPDSPKAKNWGKTLLLSAIDEKRTDMPGLVDYYFLVDRNPKRNGAAYSFKNPFDKKVTLYLDGHFWHVEAAKIYIYIKHADGSVKLLCDDTNPDAVHMECIKQPDGKLTHVRHYVKLQYETEFLPGDILVFSGIRTKEMMGKRNLSAIFYISGWGDKWNPVLVIDNGK